jgi:hypothetical protein
MAIDVLVIALFAILLPIVMVSVIAPMASVFSGQSQGALLTLSLSYLDLIDFALAKEDRAEALKTFFEWKHTVLSELLKAVVTFLLANAALAIKYAVDPDPTSAAQVRELIDLDLGPLLLGALAATILVALWIVGRLRRIPVEYSAAIRFVDLLR